MNARITVTSILLIAAFRSTANEDVATEPVSGDAADTLVNETLAKTEKEAKPADARTSGEPVTRTTSTEPALKKTSRNVSEAKKNRSLQTLNKLKNTTIPEIDFRQAHIRDVVATLQNMTEVNIVLTLPPTDVAAVEEKPDEDPFADMFDEDLPDVDELSAGADNQVPTVTMKVRQLSLLEVLKLVCTLTDLRISINGNIVMLEDKNEPVDDIQVKTFNVLPNVSDRIKEIDQDIKKAKQ